MARPVDVKKRLLINASDVGFDPNKKVAINKEELSEVLHQVRKQSIEPFQDLLTELIGNKPTTETLNAWAQKKPAEWISSLKTVANLAGYKDTINHQITISERYQAMSDAEIEIELKRAAESLQTGIGIKVIEHRPGEDEGEAE